MVPPAADQGHGRVDDESQRRAARDVERQLGSDVDPGQAHDGNGAEDSGTAGRGEPGQGGGAHGAGDGGVS
jgi:hypothetical protein